MGPLCLAFVVVLGLDTQATPGDAQRCIACHESQHVASASLAAWRGSRHASAGVNCLSCHVATPDQTRLSLCPTPHVRREVPAQVCGGCHAEELSTFAAGPHALAGQALERASAVAPALPDAVRAVEGCRACHGIGERGGRCDYCHTRHTFAAIEARRPEACRNCHHGDNHPQWEQFTASRHGAIYETEGGSWRWDQPLAALFPRSAERPSGAPRAPVCAACHASSGAHARRPDAPARNRGAGRDPAAPRQDVLGMLLATAGRDSTPAAAAQPPRWSATSAATSPCGVCHSGATATESDARGRAVLDAATALVSDAIADVERAYAAGRLPRPATVPWAPDVLSLVEPPREVEDVLWRMALVVFPRVASGVHHLDPEVASASGLGALRDERRRLARLLAALPAAAPHEE